MNPLLPGNISMVRKGRSIFHGSLLFADISGFTELTGKLALHGKSGNEQLCEILNSFFSNMYCIVKEHGGSVIYSAGDSLMVCFPPDAGTAGCAKAMMERMEEFGQLQTIAGSFSLGIKIILGYGSWGVFVVGDAMVARLVLTGELMERIALAEKTAARGEIVSIASTRPVSIPCRPPEQLPDSAFYIPGTENLQGEHRSISAIFLNITGYDPAMPPLDRIRHLYTDISRITMEYRGVIQMVDSVLAGGLRVFLLFGAPRSYGGDLIQGVQAGLDIMGRLSGLEGLQVRMGMDTGYAFAGVIGNSWRKNYTVIGEVVNTAARIADSARPGSFLISDRVYRMSRNDFECIEKGNAELKGMGGTFRLFSPSRRRPDPVYSYRFVGRGRETDELMDRILSGGCLTLIEGDAGIGKTRFLDRLRHLLVGKGFTVATGSSSKHGQTDEILATLVADMAGMLQSDTRAVRKSRLCYLIHELEDSRGTLSRREPFLGRMLFSIEYPESDYDNLPPKLRRENLVDGVCDLIGRMGGPVCVILDNIHNCTDEDLKTVEYICRNVLGRSGSDVSFVLSRRPDDRVLFESGDPEAVNVTLGKLDEKARDELMLEILEGRPLEGPLEELIVKRTEGNPFYLMQFLLYLIEERLIALMDDIWAKTADYSDNKLPESIFSMIMARIDRLEKQAKRSLRIGSVMGMSFDEKIVGRVAETDVRPSLSECSDAGLIYRSELRALEFVFSHTLIKDVTYDSILRKRRKSIHGTIGSILEETHQQNPEPVCPVLAHHFQTAEIWDKALDYNIMAGEKAWSEYRNQNAIQHYSNAVKIMEEHPEDLPDKRAWCFRELGRVHDRLGEYDLALEFYDKTLATSSDIEITGHASLMKADIMYTQGHVDESLAMLDDIEDAIRRSGEDLPLLMIRIECFRAWVYCVKGTNDIAMEKALKAVELSEALTGVSEREKNHRSGFAYNTLATVHWANGDYPSAGRYYQKALAIARDQDLKREMAVTWGNIGLVSLKSGNINEAVDSFSSQHSLAGQIGDKLIVLSSKGYLSMGQVSLGQLSKAMETALAYLKQAEELPSMQDILIACNQLSLISLVMGNGSDALAYSERTLNMSGGKPYDRERTNALLIMGMCLMEEGDDNGAKGLFSKAEDLARKIQSKSLLLNIITTYIACRWKERDLNGVSELLMEAETLVDQMGIRDCDGRINLLRGMVSLLLDEREKALVETGKAILLFRERSLKPALAGALDLICDILESVPEGSSPSVPKRHDCLVQLRELESEMNITANRRSPVLHII